jgi:hypothetical protein
VIAQTPAAPAKEFAKIAEDGDLHEVIAGPDVVLLEAENRR